MSSNHSAKKKTKHNPKNPDFDQYKTSHKKVKPREKVLNKIRIKKTNSAYD
jgi:hypothetical protein